MAVKCILTGQTPSVLDGVTENVQTQLNDKVDKVTGKGLSTNDYTSAEKTKLSGIETGAQKNTITGVKGSAETTYRTGNVNITATNIGLGNVNNTSDANKPISNATQAALNDKQSKITANGILKGDGTGTITAAEETEVQLVELTADSIGASPKSRILNITLPTASWTGSGPYTQTVAISGGTANTKVDIMINDTVYQQMVDDQVGYLAIANNNGTFTATVSGGKPSADLSIQVECKEVTPPQS